MKHYTKTQLEAFKEAHTKGETLTPRRMEALNNFLNGGSSEPIIKAGSPGGDSVPTPLGRRAEKEGTGSASPSPIDVLSSKPAVTSSVDPDSIIDGILEGAAPATNDRPVIPPSEPVKVKQTRKPRSASYVPPGPDPKAEACKLVGRQCCDMLRLAGITFMGPEWEYLPPVSNPQGVVIYNEREVLYKAWEDCAVAYGWDYVPPWVGVLVATGSYVTLRLNMPQTKARIEKWSMGKAWQGIKNKFFKKKESHNAGPDTVVADSKA